MLRPVARMVPANGARKGAQASAVERRLYERLARALPDSSMVIHQAKWVGAGTPPPDGQCSFLVADPDKGLLLLAVHPGGLAYDPHGDRWRSGTSAIPDPTTLLDTYAHGLGTLLGRQPSAPLTRPMVGWALVLPDAFVGSRGLAPQAPASRIIDRQGLDDIAARLDQLFSHWHERQPARGNASPRWWWRAMEELFVAPREVRVRLRDQIDADRADMLALSTQQTAVLEMLSRVRRLTVYGPAGTGKTVLALAKARSLAQRGQRVLLTCYNKALGHYLREETAQEPAITAMHFHELCCDFAGLTQEQRQPPTGAGAVNRFYDETLPNLLKHHAQLDGPQYDAVVVDEAQDFLPRWWDALDALCHDGDRAIRYLFYDDGQCLRTHKPPVPGAAEALVLRTNWRNTKTIHGWLGKTEPRVRATPCASPSGVPVQVERMAAGLEQVLRRVLRRLIDGGGLAPEDIVILTGRNPDRSAVAALAQPVGPAVISKDGGPGVVRLSSVYAFKGLEARVVILTELNQAKRSRALFYVGASRAMNHLIVLEDALPGPESQS